jgi:hypothetical protein
MSSSGTALLVAGSLLGASLLLGAALIALAQRWWRKEESPRLSPSDQLAQFRSLYEQGGISEEEFNRVRALLLEQIRQETLPTAAATAAAPGSSTGVTSEPPPGPRRDTPPPRGVTPPPETPPEPPQGIQPG